MKLKGNTILITGGSSGIGLALAKKFVELENIVIVTGRSADRLAAVKQVVPALYTVRCDASDPQALRALANTIEQEHPKLNVLFNNAGVMLFKNLAESTPDLVELTVELDVTLPGRFEPCLC